MTRTQLRQLTTLSMKACAILIPLSAGGHDSHGGKIDPAKIVEALKAIEEASKLAKQITKTK